MVNRILRAADRGSPGMIAFSDTPIYNSVKGGEKTVSLPRKVRCVTDLLTGAVIARDADSFTASFATPDTRLFTLDW